MHIKSLSTENFRNLYPQEIVFDSGVNIFTGMNAQGKTNIIEALWLYSSCKSFRTTNEKDFINHYKTVDEGIENRINKYIIKCRNLDELILKIKTKR